MTTPPDGTGGQPGYGPQPGQGQPQPHGGQPYPGQPYPGQPYPGQSYPGQQRPGQPYPGQPYPGPLGQYGYVPARTSGLAVAILVLGIVSVLMMCGYGIGLVPAVVALCLAPGARREIAASGGAVTGEGMVRAGVICSWVAVGVSLALIAFVVLVVVGSIAVG
jgi:hypothetical protein